MEIFHDGEERERFTEVKNMWRIKKEKVETFMGNRTELFSSFQQCNY